MYEHFRNEVLIRLSDELDGDKLDAVAKVLDAVSTDYEFSKKCTDLIVYEDHMPKLVEMYLVCKKIEGLSDKSLYNYGLHLKNFFTQTKKAPEEVAPNDIRAYLYVYQKQHGISNRSLDKIRQVINGFYQWLQDEDYVQKNPGKVVSKIKYESKPRTALTQMELEYIRRACRTARERAIIETLYSTGCRVSELINLKLTDVDFETKKVHLLGKGSKHRESFMNAKAEVAIKEYLEIRVSNDNHLFVSERAPHGAIGKAAVEKIVRDIASRIAGNEKNITPHVFRHTTATTAIQNGMPVQSIQLMLGHSKIDTTMIYAHTNVKTAQDQHSRSVI